MALITYTQIKPGLRAYETHSFVVAADLGQSSDPTAIAIVEKIATKHIHSKGAEIDKGEQFHIRYLRRLPLGLSYVAQKDEVVRLLSRAPLDIHTPLILDETGVGRAVCDIFEDAGLNPIRVTITAGSEQASRGRRKWSVPKGVLISHLDARLHLGELKISDALAEGDILREELKDFRRHVSDAGRYQYTARQGKHDDALLACALGLWGHVGLPKRQTVHCGKYRFT
jgi:hypothetical protein